MLTIPLLLPPIRSYAPIASGSLESWLLSNDPRDHELLQEAFARLGPQETKTALRQILDKEVNSSIKKLPLVGLAHLSVLIVPQIVSLMVSHCPRMNLLALSGWVFVFTSQNMNRATVLQRRIYERLAQSK
jgi:hypothetical protein